MSNKFNLTLKNPSPKYNITLKKPVMYNITLKKFAQPPLNPNHVAIAKMATKIGKNA